MECRSMRAWKVTCLLHTRCTSRQPQTQTGKRMKSWAKNCRSHPSKIWRQIETNWETLQFPTRSTETQQNSGRWDKKCGHQLEPEIGGSLLSSKWPLRNPKPRRKKCKNRNKLLYKRLWISRTLQRYSFQMKLDRVINELQLIE